MILRYALAALAMLGLSSALPSQEKGVTMRLTAKPGSTYRYRLTIEKRPPADKASLTSTFRISAGKGSTLNMECTLDRLEINGRDRTPELKSACGGQTAVLPWTNLSRRTGQTKGFHMTPGKADVDACLMEAGIYMPCFQSGPVKLGDSWPGSTTATGGCTGGKFTFKQKTKYKDRTTYLFEVSRIAFLNGEKQLGPMLMTVAADTGMPIRMEYWVQNAKGAKTHFLQQLISETRVPK